MAARDFPPFTATIRLFDPAHLLRYPRLICGALITYADDCPRLPRGSSGTNSTG